MGGGGGDKLRIKATYDNYYRANPFQSNELRIDNSSSEAYGIDGYSKKPFEISNNFGVNLDYYISKQDFLNITTKTSLVRTAKNLENNPFLQNLISDTKTFLPTYNTRFGNNYVIGNYTIFYRRTMKKSSDYLSVNTNLGFMNAVEDVDTYYSDGSSLLNHELGNKFNASMKIEYNNKINDWFRINVGGQGYVQDFNGKVNDLPNKNDFINYRYNGYGDFYFSFGKLQFKAGVRAEVNKNIFDDACYGSTNQFSLRPNAAAIWSISSKHKLRLEYRRQTFYPSAWMLAPYEIHIDDKAISRGNPGLKQSFVDLVELTYTLRSEMANLNLSAYYSNNNKMISSITTFDDQLNSVITPYNAGHKQRTGFKLNGEINLLQGALSIEPEFNGFRESMQLGNNTRYNWSFRAGGTVMLYLPLGFGVGSYGSYTGKILSVQGYRKPTYAIDAIFVMKRFEKIGLNLFAGYQNIAESPDIDYIIDDKFTKQNYFKYNSKGFIVRLNYYFSIGKKQARMEDVNTYFDNDRK